MCVGTPLLIVVAILALCTAKDTLSRYSRFAAEYLPAIRAFPHTVHTRASLGIALRSLAIRPAIFAVWAPGKRLPALLAFQVLGFHSIHLDAQYTIGMTGAKAAQTFDAYDV
jgi:hypothetical protein